MNTLTNPHQQAEIALLQITEADYKAWRHHPVTKVLYLYLRDYQQALQEKALAHLLQDSDPLDPKYIGEIAGRIKAVAEIPDLPFAAILSFYRKDEDEATLDIPEA